MTLEGASPVSFRSVLGNFFFSKNDDAICHKARKFFLLVVALPLIFLAPAVIFREWVGHTMFIFLEIDLFYPPLLGCYCSYVFVAFYISFLTARSIDGKTCMVCRRVQPEIYICRDQEFPGQIAHHLRQQPLILVKCCRLFLRYLGNYFRGCLSIVFPCQLSVSSFLGICLFPIALLSLPVVAILLFSAMSVVAVYAVYFTSPVNTIFFCYNKRDMRQIRLEHCSSTFVSCTFLFRDILFSHLAFAAVLAVLSYDANAMCTILLWATPLLLSEKTLPYVACVILVFYYLWSSYNFFTNKYQVMALMLYKHHKTSAVVTDEEAGNTPIPSTLMKIPKELYDLACEQLMPIRVSICSLLLRLSLILVFVFVVFFLIEGSQVDTTPATRALLTFLSGLLPKIIDIFVDQRQQNIEAIALEEKVQYIIIRYNRSATEHTREQPVEIVTM